MILRSLARNAYRRCFPDYADPRFPFTDDDEAAEAKHMERSSPAAEKPLFTLVIQFHNRGRNAAAVFTNFRDTCAFPAEIIAVDDGSTDDTLQRLAAVATRPQDFVLRANNLFEIKTYNRALMMARGEYVVFLQDDDFAASARWSLEAERIFRERPKVAILGGRDGLELFPVDVQPDTANPIAWSRHSTIEWQPGHSYHWSGVCNYRIVGQKDSDGLSMVDAVNMAPFIVRRGVALELGGFDEIFAPLQVNDVDFCLRAIARDYDVGVFTSDVQHGRYQSGTRRTRGGRIRTTRQSFRNWQIVYKRHAALIAARAAMRGSST